MADRLDRLTLRDEPLAGDAVLLEQRLPPAALGRRLGVQMIGLVDLEHDASPAC